MPTETTTDTTPEAVRLPWVREALATHEAFRKMGYPSSAIFVAPQSGRLLVGLRFKEKQFFPDVGPCPLSHDLAEFKRVWGAAVAWWNANCNTPEGEKILERVESLQEQSGVRHGDGRPWLVHP